ncbi:MAG: tetratricopeptide repeat protein [Pseudomonadota bacterium]
MSSAPSPATTARWQLGDWLIEPARNSLRPLTDSEAGERTLEPRVMAVLELLLRQSHQTSGGPVSDEQLLAEVWPGIAVSDASVYQAIAQLRKALGDSGKPYRYVGRVSGKGYVLLQKPVLQEPVLQEPVPVVAEPSAAPAEQAPVVSPTTLEKTSPKLAMRWLWPLPALAIAAGALWWALQSPPPPAVSTEPAPQIPAVAAGTDPGAKPDSPGWDDYLQGRWLWQQRKPAALAEAATHFRAAIEKDPQLALAYVGLCDVFHFQHLYGDWPLSKVLAQCEPLLREALQREPELGAALASFGLLKLTQNELDAADTFLDRALTREPNNAMAWLWSGQIRQRRGDFTAAAERMQRAAELDPLSAIVKRSQSHLLMNTGDFAGAQAAFEEALLREPDYADRPVDEIEMRPLTIERAVAFIQWAKRFPDRSAASNTERGLGVQTNLAMVYLALRDLPNADAALKQAEAVAPQHPYVQLTRAVWQRANGEPHKALQTLQQRAAQSAHNPFYRQVALLQQAELTGADAARQQFEREYPDYQTAITPPLQMSQLRTLISWLWLAPESQRKQLQPAMQEFLTRTALPARMQLQLRLLVGEHEAVSRDWLTLLQAGALPSPADDYFLPEHHPLWRQFPPAAFAQLEANRRSVQQQLR